jgi:hypothetical protein
MSDPDIITQSESLWQELDCIVHSYNQHPHWYETYRSVRIEFVVALKSVHMSLTTWNKRYNTFQQRFGLHRAGSEPLLQLTPLIQVAISDLKEGNDATEKINKLQKELCRLHQQMDCLEVNQKVTLLCDVLAATDYLLGELRYKIVSTVCETSDLFKSRLGQQTSCKLEDVIEYISQFTRFPSADTLQTLETSFQALCISSNYDTA